MDRRNLLALVAALPALAATPATACSFQIKSPRFAGLQNQQVQRLFEAWWQRDSDAFRALFINRLMNDGSRMDRKIADELARSDPLPSTTFDIFDRFFSKERKDRSVNLIVNTDAGIVVGCSEADGAMQIEADCAGTPKLHLFMVSMAGLNVRAIVHLSTGSTPEPDKFNIWTGG